MGEEVLDLGDLGDGTMVGLSPEVGSSLAQAGAVYLRGDETAPGYATVVEFGRPLAAVETS